MNRDSFFHSPDKENSENSEYSEEYVEDFELQDASSLSFIGKKDSEVKQKHGFYEENSEEEEKQLLESIDYLEISHNTKLEIESSRKKQQELKNFPEIYEKLTNNLQTCAKHWFDCEEKLEQIKDFQEKFLNTFSFSYYYETVEGKQYIRKQMKLVKDPAKLAELSKKSAETPRILVYTPEIDEIFINSKDVYIDIEIRLKSMFPVIIEELWDHINSRNIANLYTISAEQESIRNPKSKRLIISRSDTSYNIIVRPTLQLKQDFHYFNTKLVSTYAKVDHRFKIIAAFLTIWCKHKGFFSWKKLQILDLYHMLVFFFLHNGFLPSLQKDFEIKPNFLKVLRKSHKNREDQWVRSSRDVDFAFEDDLIKIKTMIKEQQSKEKEISRKQKNKSEKSKDSITSGEILPKFFYFFGFVLPELFYDNQTRENEKERQLYVILDCKSGKMVHANNLEIENLALKKGLGDRKEIDKGIFLKDPFLADVSTKHLIGRMKRKSLLKNIKSFFYENPYENEKSFFKDLDYEEMEYEFYCAYKRIISGNARDIFDKINYREEQEDAENKEDF